MTGDALRVIRSRAGHRPDSPLGKSRARADRLGGGGGFGRAVTRRARFTHPLGHRGAFKSGFMTIGAIGAPYLTARDVDQMELLFQTVLRSRAGQVLELPFFLRNALPRPPPVGHWISE